MQTTSGAVARGLLGPALGWALVALSAGRLEAAPGRAGIRRHRRAPAEPTAVAASVLHPLAGRIVRWPVRAGQPLAVWIAPPADRGDGGALDRASVVAAVAAAVAAWDAVGLPVRFGVAPDSARADLRVDWTDHFGAQQTGRTDWVWPRGRAGHLTRAHITLARHHADGTCVAGAELRAIALHEVGHALGLGHASDPASVMAPFVAARALTPDAVRAARLLYALPPGRRPARRRPVRTADGAAGAVGRYDTARVVAVLPR